MPLPTAPGTRGIAATAAAATGPVFGRGTMLAFSFGVFIAPLQCWLVDRFGGRRVVLLSIPLFAGGLIPMSRPGGDIRVFYLLRRLLPVVAR